MILNKVADMLDNFEGNILDYIKENKDDSYFMSMLQRDCCKHNPNVLMAFKNLINKYGRTKVGAGFFEDLAKQDPDYRNSKEFNTFLKAMEKAHNNEMEDIVENLGPIKRQISSNLSPEEFVENLKTADSLGIYWTYGDFPSSYEEQSGDKYLYTFTAEVSPEDIDMNKTKLAHIYFDSEEEVRLKPDAQIRLLSVKGGEANDELELPSEVLSKTFRGSSGKTASTLFNIQKVSDLGEEVAEKLELTDKTDQKEQPKFYNFRANIDESYKDMSVDQIYPSGIETRFYATASEGGDSGSQNISVVDKVTEQVTNKVTENPVSPVSGTSGAPKNYADGTKTMKNYADFEVENGIYIEADLNSKTPYLVKDLERAGYDRKDFDDIISDCNKADPTGDQASYTQWILRQYLNNNFKGEEDIDKFKDILTKFTKLKNSKKIQPADLNQYKSYGELVEKVNNILNESGGYTSKREEEVTKATEGIQKIDQDGGIELFVVDTPEAASKEFRNTEWCVRDPRWFNNYAETDKNFYYFKKDGKPYLLLHRKDFRNVNDGVPSDENLQNVAKLMIKHNLPNQYELLFKRIITKENGELFNQLVDKAIEEEYEYPLLINKVITREDGELFNQAVNEAIKKGDGLELLSHKLITREDGELFDKAVNRAIEEGRGYALLYYKIITKEDSGLFNQLLDEAIENGYRYDLLSHKFITRENGELFNKAVNGAIKEGDGYALLRDEIITEEELEKYKNNLKDQPEQEQEQSEENQDKSEDDTNKTSSLFETINKVAYWEELFGNPFPNIKPSNLNDIGVQLDCNDTTKDTSKDTKKRFTEPSVLPQVYVSNTQEDINKNMTEMENAKYAPHSTNRIPLDFNKEDINKQSDLLTDFNRPWDISESDNILRNRAPITEVNKEEKDKLKQETKKVHKPIKNIPISMNFPYIEDEMGLNKIYYGDMDWISMTDLSQL